MTVRPTPLYVELKAATPLDSIDLEDGVTADLDGEGHVIGIEVLDAHKRLGREGLAHLTVERLNGESVLIIKDGPPVTE